MAEVVKNIFEGATKKMHGAGFRRGMDQVFDLTKAFEMRNITFVGMDGFTGQNDQ